MQLVRVLTSPTVIGTGTRRAPTEREIAETLGVSRSAVRERLTALEALGLVRRTQGSGTYVEMPHWDFVRLYFEMAVKLGRITTQDLQRARELLEREVVREAAGKATNRDLGELTRLAERMMSARTFRDGDEADYQFHMRLVAIADNPVLSLVMDGLSPVLRELLRDRRRQVRRYDQPTCGAPRRTDADHVPIVEALRAGDPEAAARAMDEHFRLWAEMSGTSTGAPQPTDELLIDEGRTAPHD